MTAFHLESERFDLKPAGARQLHDLKKILSDPEVVKMLLGDVSTPEGIEKEALKWIDDAEYWARHRFGSWGIFDRDGAFGRPDGLLGIAAASPPMAVRGESPEIFYFLQSTCWGKGVAFEATQRMCRYLFDDLQVPALEASIFAEVNPGSVRLAGKLGFRAAGRVSLRDHGLDDARLQEIVDFDLWRIRTAAPEALQDTLSEAAFRIGQTLAEDLGSLDGQKVGLLEVLPKDVRGDPSAAADLIDRQLQQGMQARGLALYRAYRRDFNL